MKKKLKKTRKQLRNIKQENIGGRGSELDILAKVASN